MKYLYYMTPVVIALSAYVLIMSHQSPPQVVDESTTSPASAVAESVDADLIPIGDTFVLPILNFHHIGTPPEHSSPADRVWYASEETLRLVLDAIERRGYMTLTLTQVSEYLARGMMPRKAVVITFDDGSRTFMTHAYPVLRERGMASNVMLMSGVRSQQYVSLDDVRELSTDPLVEFHSHTVYHAHLTRVDDARRDQELLGSKRSIEAVTGKPVVAIAYPFGLYSDTVMDAARTAGYQLGLTIEAGYEQHIKQPLALKRFNVTNTTNIERLFPQDSTP